MKGGATQANFSIARPAYSRLRGGIPKQASPFFAHPLRAANFSPRKGTKKKLLSPVIDRDEQKRRKTRTKHAFVASKHRNILGPLNVGADEGKLTAREPHMTVPGRKEEREKKDCKELPEQDHVVLH